MNERIRELWMQSAVRGDTEHAWTYDPNLHVEKFAELIVRECMNQCFTEDGERIRKHFGVEE